MVAFAENTERYVKTSPRARGQDRSRTLSALRCSKLNPHAALRETDPQKDAQLGSCSRDPIRYGGGLNLYFAYFVLNGMDPRGLWAIEQAEDSGDDWSLDDQALNVLIHIYEDCFFRCFVLGKTDAELEALLQDLISNLPQALKDHLIGVIKEKPLRGLLAIVSIIRHGQILGDIGQGRGVIGGGLGKVLGDNLRRDLREKLAKELNEMLGKGGRKAIGRIAAKTIPVVGKILLAAEGCEAVRCKSVCNDGEFTEDDDWPGYLKQITEEADRIRRRKYELEKRGIFNGPKW